MKKVLSLGISILIVILIVLLILFKIGLFENNNTNIFGSIKQESYEKPKISEDHTFIDGFSTTITMNKKNIDILAYYYYDEIDSSEYIYDEETDEEIIKNKKTSYYLIRDLYLNGTKIGESSKIYFDDNKELKDEAEEDFNSIKHNFISDKENDDVYLTLSLTSNIMNTGLTHIKTYDVLIINKNYEIIKQLENGSNIGYINIPIYKDELGDRSYLNGIQTFNKMFDTNFDYLLYSENGYVDILDKKIYYIDVNASKCEIDEYELTIINGEVKTSFSKTYPDVSKYVTGENYC